MIARRILLTAGTAALLLASGLPTGSAAEQSSRWIVPAPEAAALIEQGALVIDARDPKLKSADPVPGAVEVVWQDFSEPDLPTKGRLLADDVELTRRLQAIGVDKDSAIIVLADPINGWGEDGRITWMLRSLGQQHAVAVDGGLPALAAVGLPEVKAAKAPGDFVVTRDPSLAVTREELKAELGQPNLVILDTREPREYAGETPYGETRGGHVPGAEHIWFKDLLGPDGKLLPRAELQAKLTALGVGPNTQVVSYCTGGIRSGWVTTVLNDLGYKAKNFAGSMWDWSSGDPAQFPLQTAAN